MCQKLPNPLSKKILRLEIRCVQLEVFHILQLASFRAVNNCYHCTFSGVDRNIRRSLSINDRGMNSFQRCNLSADRSVPGTYGA